MTIVFLNVDAFKSINDRFGHAACDRLLVAIATLLRVRLRAFDLTARLGGDEFAALLVTTDAFGARKVLRDIQERIATDTDVRSYGASVSIGAVTFEQAPGRDRGRAHAGGPPDVRAKRDGRGRLRHEAVTSERRTA